MKFDLVELGDAGGDIGDVGDEKRAFLAGGDEMLFPLVVGCDGPAGGDEMFFPLIVGCDGLLLLVDPEHTR